MIGCSSFNCPYDYPHTHEGNHLDGSPIKLKWPDNLKWQRPDRHPYGRECAINGGNPYYLFKFGWFASHSGFQLPFKIDCGDGFEKGDWEGLAAIIAWKFAFSSVYGIPRGGVDFARALDKYVTPGYPVLIVDDVLTTGRSFLDAKAALGNPEGCIGVVVFARGTCPSWVWPIMTVNEWCQSRATGLG